MTVQTSLDYQNHFFQKFTKAWHAGSAFELYKAIDETTQNLRLALTETPAYILAYNKDAVTELELFLKKQFITYLRATIPFFEVTDNGEIYFGDWYHRRQFGVVDTFARMITQQDDRQAQILPHLEAFAEDAPNYLDNRLAELRKTIYSEVDNLSVQLEAAEAKAEEEVPEEQPSNTSLRGLLKNFIDPSDEGKAASKPAKSAKTSKASASHVNSNTAMLKTRLDQAKTEADDLFDQQKRQVQVDAAVTRYEYQAVVKAYGSVEKFEEALAHLSQDFMKAQRQKEATHA